MAGGVGGAKLSQGLAEIVSPDDLTIIVNTADDFVHYGLHISPDLDTVCYTLAGVENRETGWGLEGDCFTILEILGSYGGPTWFALGDKDIATHLERTRRLISGETLTEITDLMTRNWGINHHIIPMTDDTVSTKVDTEEFGMISFQEYFVKYAFKPKVRKIIFYGIENAKPSSRVLKALDDCDAIIICPSNPLLSIDPIIQIPGIMDYLMKKYVICVSPIIQNKCLKGPLSKILEETGQVSGIEFIIDHYKKFMNCIIIDNKDKYAISTVPSSGIIALAKNIYLPDLKSRARLAREIVQFLDEMV